MPKHWRQDTPSKEKECKPITYVVGFYMSEYRLLVYTTTFSFIKSLMMVFIS